MDEEKNLAEIQQQEEPEVTEPKTPKKKNTDSKLNASHSIRALAVGYILYMLYQIVSSYIKGGEEAPSLWLLILAIVVLGGGSVWIVYLTIRDWKKSKEEDE